MTLWYLPRKGYNCMGAAGARGHIVQGRRSPVEINKSGPGGSLFPFTPGSHLFPQHDSLPGFLPVPGFSFGKQNIYNLGQFPGDGSSAGFLALSSPAQSFVIDGYLGVVLSGAGRGQEEGHLQHTVAFMGHAGADLELSALPHSGIKAAVADEFFSGGEATDVAHFGQDDGRGDLPYAGNGGKGLVREVLPEEVPDLPVDFGHHTVVLKDLGGEVPDHELFGRGKFLKRGFVGHGKKPLHMHGAGVMSCADFKGSQVFFSSLKEKMWGREMGEAEEDSCGQFSSGDLPVVGKEEAEEMMEAVFEGGAGFDQEAAEAGKQPEALDVERGLIGGSGLQAEEVEGDGAGVDPVGFSAGKQGFSEVSDGGGIEFVDLDGAAVFVLKGAEEAEVMVAGSLNAADDGRLRATEGASGYEGGRKSDPAFRSVGEGSRRTDRTSFGIEELYHQFPGTDIHPGVESVFHDPAPPMVFWASELEASRSTARPNLLNGALMAQIVIKALGRDGRGQSPSRGLTPQTMKASSSTSRPRNFCSSFPDLGQPSQQPL